MGHMHEHLDKRRLADLAADPDFMPRAERATLNTAGQAINAAMRAGYQATHPETAQAQALAAVAAEDDSFESLQPLGQASVMVGYSFNGTDLSVDGATINGEFVHIDCFTSGVRGQWYRAIQAEERKAAEIDKWTAQESDELLMEGAL